MTAGRPSKYTNALADKICRHIEDGKGLGEICEEAGMPARQTVHQWIIKHDTFRDKYAHARDIQAETYADEIIHIADNDKDLDRAKVKIDARKWTASKLKPKKYGNFHHIDHGGKQELLVTFTQADADEVDAELEDEY